MSISSEVRVKIFTLRIVALALILLGAAAVVLGAVLGTPNYFGLFFLGPAVGLPGLWLGRRAKAVVARAQGKVAAKWSLPEDSKRVRPLAWTQTEVSLVACGVLWFVVNDNGNSVWPVYALFAAMLWLGGCLLHILMKVVVNPTAAVYRMSGQRPPGPDDR